MITEEEKRDGSAPQIQWEDMTNIITNELDRRILKIQELSINDLHTLICAVRDHFGNIINSKSFDAKVEKATHLFGDT